MSRERRALGRASWQRNSELVKRRDGYRCCVCGSARNLVAGHRTPPERYGGSHDDMRNLWTLCQSCNVSQGSMTVDEWKATPGYQRRVELSYFGTRTRYTGRKASDVIRGDRTKASA